MLWAYAFWRPITSFVTNGAFQARNPTPVAAEANVMNSIDLIIVLLLIAVILRR